MNTALLFAAVSMGFLGSPHCLGMCGGIVAAFGLSMQTRSPRQQQWLTLVYHGGRLTSYMLLGLVAGSFGATMLAPLTNNGTIARVLLGVALIFCAMLMLGMPMLKPIEKLGLGLWQRLSPLRQKLFPLDSTPKAFLAGLLWGFLPCGLVYGAIALAIGAGSHGYHDITTGILVMFAFGIGTLPLLLSAQSTVNFLQNRIQKFSLRKLGGVLMLLSGIAVAAHPLMHSHHHDHHHGHGHHHHH